MSKYLILLINGASSLLLLKTFYEFIFYSSQKESKLDFVTSKIKKLEQEIIEIHIVIDTLDEKVEILEEKVESLEKNVTNKLDNILTSNYDMINLSINTH